MAAVVDGTLMVAGAPYAMPTKVQQRARMASAWEKWRWSYEYYLEHGTLPPAGYKEGQA